MKGGQKREGRIMDGNVTAVAILEALIKHKHFDPLIKASRQTGRRSPTGPRPGPPR